MPTIYKVLGQARPTGTANTDLYTVPSGTSAVISTITVTNTSASSSPTFRIFVRPGGAAAAVGNSLVYDAQVAFNDVKAFTLGITLSATDIVTVQTSVGSTLTFQAFGSEIS